VTRNGSICFCSYQNDNALILLFPFIVLGTCSFICRDTSTSILKHFVSQKFRYWCGERLVLYSRLDYP